VAQAEQDRRQGEQEYREGFSGGFAERTDDSKRARELTEFLDREARRSDTAERRHRRRLFGRRPQARRT